ncbi:hypothetical protein [Bacillus sp. es.036]|uniref:hypothetical protein n=1 Tax=Bacillus sp. es.036 TaxID=1761764 RepID=UPI000C01BB01|nr:hypothetical protein [Bacillus sp. es.036]PFG12196.1 hypothetical protein ATG70_0372 [Bacillus sp. es.036]
MKGQKKEKKDFFKIQNEYRRKVREKGKQPSPTAELKSIVLIFFTLILMKWLYMFI